MARQIPPIDLEPDPPIVEIHRGPLYVEAERNSATAAAVHVWLGPFGVHLFFPDFWKSRLDVHRP